MATGRIKKLTNKGFGFIDTGSGDLFFHASAVQGVRFDDLHEGQEVEYEVNEGPKGARAESIQVL
ncbi:MAG: cold shock domain-containing protein [Planctomycetaceae bacterium]